MANTGKALTNVAFRAKMLALIDKLKNQEKTALVRHVDDFEALNKDTFEAGMNAVIEAVPEGGGGGGGTGDGGYVVTFTINPSASSETEMIVCDKTINDIIAHANEHIVGRLIVADVPVGEDPSFGVTAKIYCDNMRFLYQKLESTNPEVTEDMLSEATYLGFISDSSIFQLFNEGEPLDNEGPEDYYKTYIKISYMFAEENPYWMIYLSEGESKDTYVNPDHITFPNDKTWDFSRKVTVNVITETGVGNAEMYGTSFASSLRYEQSFLSYFMPPDFYEGNIIRTALYGPRIDFANGSQVSIYGKAAQVEVYVNPSADIHSFSAFDGIFTIDKFQATTYLGSMVYAGFIEMHMDEDDATNNRIIKHLVKVEALDDDGNNILRTTYKRVAIPYTVI